MGAVLMACCCRIGTCGCRIVIGRLSLEDNRRSKIPKGQGSFRFVPVLAPGDPGRSGTAMSICAYMELGHKFLDMKRHKDRFGPV